MIVARYLAEARAELRAAIRRAEDERAGRGSTLEAAVARVIARLRVFPRSAPLWPDPTPVELRRAVVRHHPSLVVYTISPDQLVIVAVAHTSKQPGYWVERLEDVP